MSSRIPWSFIARRHYEYKQGWDLIGNAYSLLTFETFAMVFCEKFGITGTVAALIYVGAPIAAIIGIMVLGRTMISVDYANKLSRLGMDVNTDWLELKENIREIHKKTKEDEKP